MSVDAIVYFTKIPFNVSLVIQWFNKNINNTFYWNLLWVLVLKCKKNIFGQAGVKKELFLLLRYLIPLASLLHSLQNHRSTQNVNFVAGDSMWFSGSSADTDQLLSFEKLDRASPDLWPEKSKQMWDVTAIKYQHLFWHTRRLYKP